MVQFDKEIKSWWSETERLVAEAQLDECGVIFLRGNRPVIDDYWKQKAGIEKAEVQK